MVSILNFYDEKLIIIILIIILLIIIFMMMLILFDGLKVYLNYNNLSNLPFEYVNWPGPAVDRHRTNVFLDAN